MKDYVIKNELDDVKKGTEQSSFLGNPIEDPNSANAIKYVTYYPVSVSVKNTDAATAGNYGYLFVADKPYEVISITERHRTKGSDSGARLYVEKLTSGTAKGSGVDLITAGIDIGSGSTNDATNYATLTNTKSYLVLRRGDALGLTTKATTITSVADLVVTVLLRAI